MRLGAIENILAPATDQSDMNGQAAALSTPNIAHIGNKGLLQESLTALFCSQRCPGDVILKLYDVARSIRDAGVSVIGGFQTPLEKKCLRLSRWATCHGCTEPMTALARDRSLVIGDCLAIPVIFSGIVGAVTVLLNVRCVWPHPRCVIEC